MKKLIAIAIISLPLSWAAYAQTVSPSSTIPASPPLSTERKIASAEIVPAGLVDWHEDRASALAAAKASGRPVLIFQMLGRLDELYC